MVPMQRLFLLLNLVLVSCSVFFTTRTAALNEGYVKARFGGVERADLEFFPTLKTAGKCTNISIGILNGPNTHYELVAGLLHILQPWESNVTLYHYPNMRSSAGEGASDMLRWSSAAKLRINDPDIPRTPVDLLILASPEYDLLHNEALIARLQPRTVLAFAHSSEFQRYEQLKQLAPTVKLVALAPHVAAAVSKNAGTTIDWMLPTYPIFQPEDCVNTVPKRWLLGLCLRGFTLQGKFRNTRRNYTDLWAKMEKNIEDIADPQFSKVFHIHVVGLGREDPPLIPLPTSLVLHVTLHTRIEYRYFYSVIAFNVGLVPSLVSDKYLTERVAPVVTTSLAVGVPLLADQKLLDVYSFIPRGAVFFQEAHMDEVDLMLKLSQAPAPELLKARDAVTALRKQLNRRAGEMMEALVSRACDAHAAALATGAAAQ